MRPQNTKSSILAHLNAQPQKVFMQKDLLQFLTSQRRRWSLPKSMTLPQFLAFLVQEVGIQKIALAFPHRTETRYLWNKPTLYEIAISINRNGYLSHHSAMFLHHLTQQPPETTYLNVEQPKKPRSGKLEQSRIDLAFELKPRVSTRIATYKTHKICLLNGMFTGNHGVVEMQGRAGERLRVTDLERTLIDITVRPAYSGGPLAVLEAYRLSAKRLSIDKLLKTLKHLNYVYPYHQAIGFYLERARVFPEASLAPFRSLPMKYDFYLMHNMQDKEYSRAWRLYVPKGF